MNPSSDPRFKVAHTRPGKERVSPNYSRRLSDILLEFAQEIVPAESSPDIFGNAVALIVMLWNTPLLPEVSQAENMNDLRTWLAKMNRLELQDEIDRLLEVRQARYGSDRRIVMDYKLEFETKGPSLTVKSLDLDRPQNRHCK